MAMAPGWYPDPFSNAGYLRWWDGTAWASRTTLAGAEQPEPPPAVTAESGQATFPLATWGLRLVAFLADLVVVGALCAPVVLVLLWQEFTDFVEAVPSDGSPPPSAAITDLQNSLLAASLTITVVWVVVSFGYFVPQHVRYGRSLGKRLVGIRIRMLAEDRPPRWREAILRWAVFAAGAAVAGGFFLLLDCLWPLWDRPWQQALHDKVARTVVVPR